MDYPPTKRLRGLNQDIPTGPAFDDPFGDDDDFSQDDLNEIDILASQALTSTSSFAPVFKPIPKPVVTAGGSGGQSRLLSRTTASFNRESKCVFDSSNSRSKLGREDQHQQFSTGRDDASVLEAQHAELKRKLKEVEEEILLKNGEIRVLRDALKGSQQEKETQRQNHIQQESQRQKEQCDREKELNRKVHSLQTELQFKDAEINEMKTKLLSSDKNKMASPLQRNSPKVLNSLAHVRSGSSSSTPSPKGNGFITKEIFGANVTSKATPVKKRKEGKEKVTSKSTSGEMQDSSRPDPFLPSTPVTLQSRGGVLLEVMLQQPLSPSTLSLYHLLSMNPVDINQLYVSGKPASFRLHTDAKVSGGDSRSALSPLQSLAVTGLNMMSLSQPDASASANNKRSCPGAALLLPLLDVHLSQLFYTAESARSGSHNKAKCTSVQTEDPGRQEYIGSAGFSGEDIGLASLRLLYLLVVHSDEVVECVLSKENRISSENLKCSAEVPGLHSQNALLQSMLQCLCEGGRAGPPREKLVLSALKTLCVLIERTPHTQSSRLQCVLQPLCACLSADSGLPTALQCVSVLTSACGHRLLAQKLCSQHDPCVFLKLFSFRTRTGSQSVHGDWIQLDLQVIRLLSGLMSQGVGCWSSSQLSTCQCYTELLQMLVIVFHRQWLELRGPPVLARSTDSAPSPPAASLLREGLLLLHWLQLHHGSLPEGSRPPLHMYDQVAHAVRDTLRKIPELSESEELALEEICRSESDDTDDMATDSRLS